MARQRRRGVDSERYYLRFGLTALLLVSITLVLVLFVLPQRYVLDARLRESGVNFPTTSLPFEPVEAVAVAARPLPPPPDEIMPGPAELFWEEVAPLLEAERYEEALPLFERYLTDLPTDRDVRREYAMTLLAAGYLDEARPVVTSILADSPSDDALRREYVIALLSDGRVDEAVPLMVELMEESEDVELRLLLARTLRDQGRIDAASIQYEVIVDAAPEDPDLALEWARALAWAEEYESAASVLRQAIERHPDSVALRVELARALFAMDLLEDAAAALEVLDEPDLRDAGALSLRDEILSALAVPDDDAPPPTLVDRAVSAREEGNLSLAAELFELALAERPESVEVWQAYADFLQYEMADFEGARSALLEVDRLGGGSHALQYRIAQLEIWTERSAEAKGRLLDLLVALDERTPTDPVAPSPPDGSTEGEPTVSRAEVQALLGDLYRWEGERLLAVERYRLALREEPGHQRAIEGLDALRREVERLMLELERPGLGGSVYTLSDTDRFNRLDVGGDWVELTGDWVWGGRAGRRWLEGYDLANVVGTEQGLFADLEVARWWRWGTIRTAMRVGVEQLLPSQTDLVLGLSVRHLGSRGGTIELRYDHDPGYVLTSTLQSAFADVTRDQLSLGVGRPLGERWSLAALGELARLGISGLDVAQLGGSPDRSFRMQAALSVGRAVSDAVTLGLSTRTLRYTDEAPVVSTRALYWDPRAMVSAGPFLQVRSDLSDDWKASLRLNPGFAWIDERRTGSDALAHLSAELGVLYESGKWRTAIDFFYYQGRFDGYRGYGVQLSVRALGGLFR